MIILAEFLRIQNVWGKMADAEGIQSDGSNVVVGFETESDAENNVLDRIER